MQVHLEASKSGTSFNFQNVTLEEIKLLAKATAYLNFSNYVDNDKEELILHSLYRKLDRIVP